MGRTGWVEQPTLRSHLRWCPRWRHEVPQFDHGITKLNKESKLAGGELVDNGSGISPRSGEKLLITLEKSFQALKIGVVVFVECVWCHGIEIHSCCWCGACLTKLLPVSSIQSRVWEAGVVEVVEPSREEKAPGSTERVRS